MAFTASTASTTSSAEAAVKGAVAAALRSAAPTRRVAIAYSGGADSTALLHAAAVVAKREGSEGGEGIEVFALHVHHGLAAAADDWLGHCRAESRAIGVAFDAEHVVLVRQGDSVEAEARRLRYAALARLCDRHRCTLLMTAHHADDQAETVLVNLMRGSGVGGLAATARTRMLGDLRLSRPLLDLPASAIGEYVARYGLTHVVDPSNQDRRFTRNAIRHEVMPVLRRIAPTIASRLARTATHASSMQGLLDEIGREDLARDAGPDEAADQLDVDRLAALSEARAANALRVWLAHRGLRAPSAAALKEMLDQLLHASPDAQIALLHEEQTLRLYRGRVSIEHGTPLRTGFRSLQWQGEAAIAVPEWNGVLHFDAAAGTGFDALALREGPLVLRERRGGERLRTRADGPSRTLKNLYQEAGIAAWQRKRLPLVYLADRLLFAAGIGPSATALISDASRAVRLTWTPTA